jgi:hypothetical protein
MILGNLGWRDYLLILLSLRFNELSYNSLSDSGRIVPYQSYSSINTYYFQLRNSYAAKYVSILWGLANRDQPYADDTDIHGDIHGGDVFTMALICTSATLKA